MLLRSTASSRELSTVLGRSALAEIFEERFSTASERISLPNSIIPLSQKAVRCARLKEVRLSLSSTFSPLILRS